MKRIVSGKRPTFPRELRTSDDHQIREMVPNDIWNFIFSFLHFETEDITKKFSIGLVCRSWLSCICECTTVATVCQKGSLNCLLFLTYLNSLVLKANVQISLPVFEHVFTRLNSLVIQGDTSTSPSISDRMWTRMTNLRSLDLSQVPRSASNCIVNNRTIKYLANLQSLKLASNPPIWFYSLKSLIQLRELNIVKDIRGKEEFIKKYGNNFELLENHPNMKVVELYLSNHLKCKEIQEKYPKIRFLWHDSENVYEGKFSDDNRRHGKGVVVTRNGFRIEANFEHGLYTGQIQMTSPGWDPCIACYDTNFTKGRFDFPNGNYVEVTFSITDMRREVDDLVINLSNGNRIYGRIFNNPEPEVEFNSCLFSNGDRYVVENFSATPLTRGNFCYANGDRYEGECRIECLIGNVPNPASFDITDYFSKTLEGTCSYRFLKEGKGTYYYVNGDCVEADFKDDCIVTTNDEIQLMRRFQS